MSRPVLALIILTLCALSLPAHATNPIIIYGNDTKPPESWMEEGKPKGELVDILNQIEMRTGLKFEIRLMPWKRAYTQALDGQGGIFGLSKNTGRMSLFDYSEVMFFDEMRLVVLKGSQFEYRTIEDLRGKIVGVTRGASYGDRFEEAKGTVFTASEDADPVCRLRMLLARRIDAALIGPGRAAVRYVINQDRNLKANQDQFIILDTPFERDPNYIGFNKTLCRTNTLKKVNQALAAMWKDGTIARIEQRY